MADPRVAPMKNLDIRIDEFVRRNLRPAVAFHKKEEQTLNRKATPPVMIDVVNHIAILEADANGDLVLDVHERRRAYELAKRMLDILRGWCGDKGAILFETKNNWYRDATEYLKARITTAVDKAVATLKNPHSTLAEQAKAKEILRRVSDKPRDKSAEGIPAGMRLLNAEIPAVFCPIQAPEMPEELYDSPLGHDPVISP